MAAPENINDALRAEEAAGTLGERPAVLPSIPSYNSDDPVSRKKAFAAIKQWIDQREGQTGSVMDKHLTLRDLVDAGAFKLTVNSNVIGGDASPTIVSPGDAVYTDPRPFYSTPPPLTNLVAAAAFRNIILTWDQVNYQNHSYTEIWRSATNALGTAAKIATAQAGLYDDGSALVGATYYYWVRDVNTAGTSGPFNAVPGTQAGILVVGNTDLGALTVTAEKLSAGTYPNINLVPNGGAEDGLVAWTLLGASEQVGAGLSSFALDTSDKTGGSQSFIATKVASPDGGGVGNNVIPLIPGETYSVKVKIKGSGAAAAGLYIRMQESTTKPVLPYLTGLTRTSLTDFVAGGLVPLVWTAYEFSYTVPAGVYWGCFTIYNWGNPPNCATLHWDDVSVGRQITASFLAANSIAVGSAAIQNGAIVNAMIANLAVDNAKIANATITYLKIASVDAATITVGQLTASQIDTRSLTIKDAGGNVIFSSGANNFINSVNVLKNPTARLGTRFWTQFGSPTVGTTLGGAGDGPYFYMVSGVAAIGGLQSDFYPISPGVNVILQAEMFTGGLSAGNWVMDVEFFNSSFVGVGSGAYARTNGVAGTSWTRYSNSAVAPAGAAYMCARIFLELGVTTTSAIRKIKLEASSVLTPYTDEATGGDVSLEWFTANPITAATASTYIAALAVDSLQIAGNAVSVMNVQQVAGPTSVTTTSHVPDNFSFNTTVATVTFTPSASISSTVDVLVTAIGTFTLTAASFTEIFASVQNGTYDTFRVQEVYWNPSAVSNAIGTFIVTGRFTQAANVSTTYTLQMHRFNAGDTLSVKNVELRCETYKK